MEKLAFEDVNQGYIRVWLVGLMGKTQAGEIKETEKGWEYKIYKEDRTGVAKRRIQAKSVFENRYG